ncbi:cell wall assembly and cell proliferation coordinating protein, partial [Myriangium duriaei CBS 260.36]
MAAGIAASWRSFWHTMTSNDRHASHDSPYRSGGHLPLGQSRHSPLTAVTSAAMESRTDLNADESGFVSAGSRPMSPSSPYTPGMRSMQRQSSQPDTSYAANGMGNGEVQMQNFQEGLPPPPPVSHTWKRIEHWLEDNYEELEENLGEGCTQNDVNELEHELDCSLPQDVRESLQIHDGQERGGRPSGVIFGCMLLDCEEIVQEWKQWARTNEEYLREQYSYTAPQPPIKALAGSSSQARASSPASSAGSNWRSELLARQDSQPANAVQKAYVHSSWIPLARDWGGNNICVDLAPGPSGKWGQIILMGRDYDCKYVVARSWGAFLAAVADDMASNKWFIDEDTQELKLREFPKQNVLPAYMDILRWRSDQKYGRKPPPQKMKRPAPPLKINSQVKNEFASLNGFSPYASPVTAGPDRGRSPPSASYRGPSQPSPLSRVAEESASGSDVVSPIPQKVDRLVSIDSPIIGTGLSIDTTEAQKPGSKLVEINSPMTPNTEQKESLLKTATETVAGADNEMKT